MEFTIAGRSGFYKGGHYFTIEYGPPGRSILWSQDTFLGRTLFDMTPGTLAQMSMCGITEKSVPL